MHTHDGRTLRAEHDAAKPMQDLAVQRARLVAKSERLARPVFGSARCCELVSIVDGLHTLPSLRSLATLCATA